MNTYSFSAHGQTSWAFCPVNVYKGSRGCIFVFCTITVLNLSWDTKCSWDGSEAGSKCAMTNQKTNLLKVWNYFLIRFKKQFLAKERPPKRPFCLCLIVRPVLPLFVSLLYNLITKINCSPINWRGGGWSERGGGQGLHGSYRWRGRGGRGEGIDQGAFPFIYTFPGGIYLNCISFQHHLYKTNS
jgi:hypothetical protein